ncbi:21274_t:CDS:2 [Dentiscutata erythropus]|uniref:21274_t:CDS:1 n=1 Tax=Dentiscutata erythropus TaxID=1348616 RepID=A0A9N9DAV6_9GLOM|nr:21274_t:CDS:2 [Dentiscutata erythropus]
MSLKFYIIFAFFASVLLMAFSVSSAPVADNGAGSGGFYDMKTLKNDENVTRRDAYPNPESSGGLYEMADLKSKREFSENGINDLSKRAAVITIAVITITVRIATMHRLLIAYASMLNSIF